MAELPVFEYPIRQLFAAVGVEKVIQIVSCLLLEHQIVLYAHGEYREVGSGPQGWVVY